MPSTPAPPGATTISTSWSWKTTRSPVTISTSSLPAMMFAPSSRGGAAGAQGVSAALRLQGVLVATLPQGVKEDEEACRRSPSPPEPKATPPGAVKPPPPPERSGTPSLCCFRRLAGHLRRLRSHLIDVADHVERLLRQIVDGAVENLLKGADRVLSRDVLSGRAGEYLGGEERLRHEELELASPVDGLLVIIAQLLDAEDGDDVLQVTVALQHLLHLAGDPIVLFADHKRIEDAGGRAEGVDRREDTARGDSALQRDGGVEVGEGRRRSGVGVVVGRDVDGLHRGDRPRLGRGDPLLQLPHLGRQRRLVADRARHAAEEGRDLGAGLHEAEDVVDEDENVAPLVAEVLGQREGGETDPQAGSRGLVHLTEDEHRLVGDARLLHLAPELGAFAGALAHAGEDGVPAVLGCDVADQLGDNDSLPDSSAAEDAGLATLSEGGDKVDDLDAGLEDLDGGRLVLESRCRSVNRIPGRRDDRTGLVDRLADDIEDAAECLRADRDGDGAAHILHRCATTETVGGTHGDSAHRIVAEVRLRLQGEDGAVVPGHLERVVDLRQHVRRELHVDHRAGDLQDRTGRPTGLVPVCGYDVRDDRGRVWLGLYVGHGVSHLTSLVS